MGCRFLDEQELDPCANAQRARIARWPRYRLKPNMLRVKTPLELGSCHAASDDPRLNAQVPSACRYLKVLQMNQPQHFLSARKVQFHISVEPAGRATILP